MAEELKKEEVIETKVEGTDKLYLDQITELKEKLNKSVSKDEYERALEQNKELMDRYLSNAGTEKSVKEELLTPEAYEAVLVNGERSGLNDRDFFVNSIRYRESMIKHRGIDPWNINGENPDAEEVYAVVKNLLDETKDSTNPAKHFKMLLQDSTADDPQIKRLLMSKKII